jgi:glycosyltransferase involved in cell wall biosynthesis
MSAQAAPVPGKAPKLSVCLLVDTVGWYAGTERQVAETARRLDASRFDIHVCCLENSTQLEALQPICKTAVFPAASFNSPAGFRQALRLRRYLQQNNIRIVHAYMNKTALFAVFACLFSERIVVTSRLNLGYWYNRVNRMQFKLMNLATDHVMANSRAAKRIAMDAEKLDDSRISVVYQGVDMTAFRPRLGDPTAAEAIGIPPAARVVGIVANYRPVKDLPLFLRAAALVAQRFPDVVFLLVGSGELYLELVRLSKELGIGKRVFFSQGQGKVIDYLSRMSIGCLTSLSEGFSNAIIEYMAVGLPVVATAVGGNMEAVADNQTGYLVRERSPEAFATPLVRLLEDEALRARMGQRGFERCRDNFEMAITIRSLEDFYLSLAAAPR